MERHDFFEDMNPERSIQKRSDSSTVHCLSAVLNLS